MPRQYSLFMQHIIRVLLPYFSLCTRDLDAAAADIVETLESYGVRTRAEFIKATQIIAISMVTLETLAESTSKDLSPSLRVRYRGCANSLTRSTITCEKALERRLAGDAPAKPANEPAMDSQEPAAANPATDRQEQPPGPDQPASTIPDPASGMSIPANDMAEPVADLSDEEAIAAIAQVRAELDSHRARLSGKPPAPTRLPDPDHSAWAAALMDAIKLGAAQASAGPGG
jgi:hypothetical protein